MSPCEDCRRLQERLEEVEKQPAYIAAAEERGRAVQMERQRDESRAERDSLALEVERLKEALEFYASPSWYSETSFDAILRDAGLTARTALRDGDPEAGSESSNQQSVEGR